jgi:prepilin-type N-terminal cleavage/methylation domain-containing protein
MRRGFTLLEVVIALGILAVALVVLVQGQAAAMMSAHDAEHLIRATQLAEEKMIEVQLLAEREGFSDQDIEEDGDFEEFGHEEFRGEGVDLDMGDQLAEYRWAYTMRKVEIKMPPDIGGIASSLASDGYYGEEKSQQIDASGAPNLGDIGISGDMITETLSDYIREVRVRIWWGDDPSDESQMVELTSHVVNPTGVMGATGGQGGGQGAGAGSGGGGKNKKRNTLRGGNKGGQSTPSLRGGK